MDKQPTEALISALPLPTLVVGPDQTVLAANPPAIDLLGPQILNRNVVAALRQPGLVARIETARQTKARQVGQYVSTHAARDTAYDVHIVPAESHLVLTFIDTSDAHTLDSFRRDFVANVSHELRTPLAAILGFIETLQGPARGDPEAQDRFLGIMQHEAQRMSRLVDDLLSLSRIEQTERRPPSTVVVLSDVVAQTLAELDPIIQSAGAKVVLSDQSDGCTVPADPGQLRQVLGNLIENALRYGAPGGTITIHISPPALEPRLRRRGVRLSVSDQGEGIEPHHIPRLTERFYRVDSHRSRNAGGTGLGLAIVKHIVQRHRGFLHIESQRGKGSTFTIVLPLSDENSTLS